MQLPFKYPQWRKSAHVPLLVALQIIFIALFAKYVIYNPDSAAYGVKGSSGQAKDTMTTYPMFQDVHVMIFVGFGFLMTFLKKYGLSAVSLNMLIAVVCLQWATLVIGFFHLHYEHVYTGTDNETHVEYYPDGVIYLDLVNSMLFSDFASAAVLISFGAVIGTTTPLQLIAMALIEIVLFVANEVIGRQMLGAVDAGDTIFVHLFGAYFGLAVSRVLYQKTVSEGHKNQGSAYTSDLFSMIGTVFLWLFWPSFNGAAALAGEPQHRAVLNTYFSLCASVVAAFSISALLDDKNKFVMEHIQNATLAGGVAVGAVADMMVQPFAALIIGAIAGALSTGGYHYLTPWLEKKLKIHDTCGVHNLHGVPAVIGTALSCIMAAVANEKLYKSGLTDLYPALANSTDKYTKEVTLAITPSEQAVNQLIAAVVTMAFALVGGFLTGLLMRAIGKWQAQDFRKGATVLKLAANINTVLTNSLGGMEEALPKESYFDDNLFFLVHEDAKEEEPAPHIPTVYQYGRKASLAGGVLGIQLNGKH